MNNAISRGKLKTDPVPQFRMPSDPEDESSDDLSLYQEFLAEREEILKHKWIQSEEAGHDVGFETALVDWAKDHREKWKKEYQARGRS